MGNAIGRQVARRVRSLNDEKAARSVGEALRWLPRVLRSATAHRARWGIIDQVLSSLSNFAITAVVAHQVAPAAFGWFSLALTIYICLLWIARSMVGEPFVVRMTPESLPRQTSAAREASGAALVIGAVTGSLVAMAAAAIGLRTAGPLLVIGLAMPGLLLQDSYRYILLARGQARVAAGNDGFWLLAQSALVATLFLVHRANTVGLTLAFGAGAAISALLGVYQTGASPSVAGWRRWLRRTRDLWVPFVVEFLTVNAAAQLSLLAIGVVGAVEALGELRAGIFLFAPPTVLISGLCLIGLGEAVRVRQRSLTALWGLVGGLALTMCLLTLTWAGILWSVPARLGVSLLRSNWSHGRHLLVPVAALTAATSCMLAAVVGLRALEGVRKSLRVRVLAGPVIVVSGVIGAEVHGAAGAATGLALSTWFGAALAWMAFRQTLMEQQR